VPLGHSDWLKPFWKAAAIVIKLIKKTGFGNPLKIFLLAAFQILFMVYK
jgi:hypothetical protein